MRPVHILMVGSRSLLKEGIVATLRRSHFSLALDVEDVSAITASMWSSLAQPALAIVLAHDPQAAATVVAVDALRLRASSLCIVVLCEAGSDRGGEVFRAGADGCLPSTISPDALVMALDLLIAKELAIASLAIVQVVVEGPAPRVLPAPSRPRATLSPREFEVLHAVSRGESNKHIGRRLSISEATVKAHIRLILKKTGLENRTQAAVWALGQSKPGPTMLNLASPQAASNFIDQPAVLGGPGILGEAD